MIDEFEPPPSPEVPRGQAEIASTHRDETKNQVASILSSDLSAPIKYSANPIILLPGVEYSGSYYESSGKIIPHGNGILKTQRSTAGETYTRPEIREMMESIYQQMNNTREGAFQDGVFVQGKRMSVRRGVEEGRFIGEDEVFCDGTITYPSGIMVTLKEGKMIQRKDPHTGEVETGEFGQGIEYEKTPGKTGNVITQEDTPLLQSIREIELNWNDWQISAAFRRAFADRMDDLKSDYIRLFTRGIEGIIEALKSRNFDEARAIHHQLNRTITERDIYDPESQNRYTISDFLEMRYSMNLSQVKNIIEQLEIQFRKQNG